MNMLIIREKGGEMIRGMCGVVIRSEMGKIK